MTSPINSSFSTCEKNPQINSFDADTSDKFSIEDNVNVAENVQPLVYIYKYIEYGINYFKCLKDQYYYQPAPILSFSYINQSGLDPTDYSNACKILGIAEDKAHDIKLVNQQYQKIINVLESKKALISNPLSQRIQILIENATKAHATLSNR